MLAVRLYCCRKVILGRWRRCVDGDRAREHTVDMDFVRPYWWVLPSASEAAVLGDCKRRNDDAADDDKDDGDDW